MTAAPASSIAVVDGPVRLAQELARAGYSVTLVVLSEPGQSERAVCRDAGVGVIVAPELDVTVTSRWLAPSYRFYRALHGSAYDALVFRGERGGAYCCGRAKEVGADFAETAVVVRFGEPTLRRTLQDEHVYVPHGTLGTIVTERLAAALADAVVAEPDVLAWMADRGWRLPERQYAAGAAPWDEIVARVPAQPARAEPGEPPLVSVVIPFHERTQYLPFCLESLARQTHPALEVVIADDGSASREAAAALAEAERRSWPWPFRVVRLPHGGLASARNGGWRAASADLVLFLDDDDVAFDELVSSLVRARQAAGADVVVAGARTFAGDGPPEARPGDRITISLCEPGELTLLGNHSGGPTCLWTRELLARLDGFRSTPRVVEDWHILVRAAVAGARITTPPDPLWWYRRSPTSMFGADPHGAVDTALPAMAELLAAKLPDDARLLPLLVAGAYRELERRQQDPARPARGVRALARRALSRLRSR